MNRLLIVLLSVAFAVVPGTPSAFVFPTVDVVPSLAPRGHLSFFQAPSGRRLQRSLTASFACCGV